MERESKNQFHITVGAAAQTTASGKAWQSRLDITNDLRLIKAALLYADKVRFCSYGASALLALLDRPANMNENEQLEWFLRLYQDLGHPPHIEYVTNFVREYKASRLNKRGKFQLYLNYKRALDKSFRDMDIIAGEAGIKGLNDVLDSGLVEFQSFARQGYSAEEYFDAISNALTSGETYPLVDDVTGSLIELAIKEEKISLLGISEKRAKHVGVSSGLIERLPLFDYASIDEILDIRKELEEPLIRFRAAVMGYSNIVESLPWRKEFAQTVEEIYLEQVTPTILDIEEAYKTNKSLLSIIPNALQHKGFPASSALGIALAQVSQFPETVAALSIVGGLLLGTHEAIKERREKLTEVKNHQLFFYYQAGKLLSTEK
jgi:hypothetical protein